MTALDNIGGPDFPMNVNPITVWQAAVRDKLLALEAAQPPPQVRVTRPNVTDRLVEVWDGAAWVVLDYDSGWRDVASKVHDPAAAPGQTVGAMAIRRAGRVVSFRCAMGDASQVHRRTLYTLSQGWRPLSTAYFSSPFDAAEAGTYQAFLSADGDVQWGKPAGSGALFACELSWMLGPGQFQIIPTSLDGAPIGLARPDGKEPEHETW